MSKWIELTRDMAVEMAEIIVGKWEEYPLCDIYYNVNSGAIEAVFKGEEAYYKRSDGWRDVIRDANDPETWGEDEAPDPRDFAEALFWDGKDEIEAAINGEAD